MLAQKSRLSEEQNAEIFNNENISEAIEDYLKRTSLDLKKDFQWDRNTINRFIEEEYEVTMS